MAESSRRKVGRIYFNKDRISVLPRNLQEIILCFLPIRDAVRTSILSRSWRHCWTTVPNLVFDQDILSEKSDDYSECHGPQLSSLEYVSVINKVLLLHNGPILKFSLRFPYCCDSKIIHNYVDQWIPLFSRKCIKQLTLEGHSLREFTAHNFSSLDLTHLRLENVWFPYTPVFGGLTYLRSIELIHVATSERSIFDCPVLENLTLIFCIGLSPINFQAPNLKFLHQISFEMTSEYSLARFKNITEFSFRLLCDPDIQTETSNVVKVFSGLHKIEKISIEDCFNTYLATGGSPNRFSYPLSYLKTLSISGINSTRLSEVSCLRCLIRSAPNLCKLHISKRMAESSTRKVSRVKRDRISVLPRNILEIILCFMPLRDAVRTSVLSRSWRHCWTTIPNLDFDEYILKAPLFTIETAYKFFSVINKVLLLHNGPILKFSLGLPFSLCVARVINDYLDQWIPLFSRKGIKQLTLEAHDGWEITAHNFSSLGLTHLRLSNFWFPCIPAFGGLTYTYLWIIELIGVSITEKCIFDCPVLEKLALMVSYGLSHTNFRAPNLQCLHQHYRKMISEYSSAGLENLREYSFRLSGDPPMTQAETPNVVNVLSSLHKIEKFSIAKYYIKYLAAGGSPKRLSKPLLYLRTLCCFDINFTCLSEVSCLRCLIRSAPNLCKLHISVDLDPEEEYLVDYREEDFQHSSADHFQDWSADHLEIVTFSHFQGLKAELELVKFLLACSPLLKTMFIHRNWSMKKDEAFNILEEMLEFSRASSRAQIRSLKYPHDAVDYGPWANSYDIYDYL